MIAPSFVLASNSAARRAMLDAAGVEYTAVAAEVDEAAIKRAMAGADPAATALALAEAKARRVARDRPDSLVLGADSLVALDGRIYDKPVDRADAAGHLAAFSGRTLTLISAAAFVRGDAVIAAKADRATLVVRDLSEEFIAAYLDAEWPAIAGCVGCFRVEVRGVQLFDAIEGSHFTVLGMDLLFVLNILRENGVLAS